MQENNSGLLVLKAPHARVVRGISSPDKLQALKCERQVVQKI